MAFSDPRFLPVSTLAIPSNCTGYQVASIYLPESLGDVYTAMQWYVLLEAQSTMTELSRQCEGEFTTSCSVYQITGGCNDPEAFAHEREAMKMRVTCQAEEENNKRDVGSRNLLQKLHLGNEST